MDATVGRDAETALVARHVDAIADRPTALVITGGTGIGKTTLWRAGVRRAEAAGAAVLVCRPAGTETRLAYSALADLLAGVAWDGPDGPPAVQREALDVALLRGESAGSVPDPRTLFTAVLTVVRGVAQRRPVLIAIDDAQWLDAASAEALTFLGRRLHDERVGLLCTVRTGPEPSAPLPPAAAPAGRDTVRLELTGLDPSSLHRLVRNRTGLALPRPMLLRVHEASSGNPMYALEIARALIREGTDLSPGAPLPVPRTLDELVATRLGALPEATREALLYAAALADPRLDTVRRAAGAARDRPSALSAAEEDGVIEVDGGVIRFTHPLLATLVYARATAERRQLAHRRLAEVVTAPEERAWQLALAGDGPDAVVSAALEQAAEAAQRRGAPGPAARLWELACERTPAADPRAALRRRAGTTRCLFRAGDAARARRLMDAVMTQTPPGAERAAAASELAGFLFFEGGTAEAAELCRQALLQIEPGGVLAATLHLRRAWFSTHDAPQQWASAGAAARLVERLGRSVAPELAACVLAVAAMYRFTNGGGIAAADLGRAERLLPAGGRSWPAVWARTALAAWAKLLAPRDARERFAHEYREATDAGDEAAAGHALMHLAELDCWLGDWPAAARQAAASAELVEQTGQRRWLGFSLYAAALVAAHQGRAAAAAEATGRGLRLAGASDDPYTATLHHHVLGFLELSRGDAAAADRQLTRAADLVAGMRIREPARFPFHGDQIEAAVAVGDLDRARDLLAELRRRLVIAPRPGLAAAAARAQAVVVLAAGDHERAVATAAGAGRTFARLGLTFDAARAALVEGRGHRAGKRKAAAREALLRARAAFADLGAALWVEQADDDLRRCGGPPDRSCRLTPTEERVAGLVARGLSNREVAALLHIAPKTVEVNLTRIYRKLQVRNRMELVLAVGPGGPPGALSSAG